MFFKHGRRKHWAESRLVNKRRIAFQIALGAGLAQSRSEAWTVMGELYRVADKYRSSDPGLDRSDDKKSVRLGN